MQTKPTGARRRAPASAVVDAEAEQAMLMRWQRRARAFAWACGVRVERVASDED